MIQFDLSPEEFRAEHFEKRPRHMPGALSARPIGWSDIDHLLHVLEPKEPNLRLFNHGQLPQESVTEEYSEAGQTLRRLNKVRFYELLGNGATLQINWLERHLLEAKRLCLECGRFAGTQTSGNAYMCFTGDGSFGPHWDTHDVFVIQLIGRKHWRIYEPTFPLPLALQTYDRSGHSCPPEPAIELVMEEGDVMYVPRGWWHHVLPLEGGSFHLSVGCYVPSVFDYIVQTSAKVLERQLAARQAFTLEDYSAAVSELMDVLPKALLDPASAKIFERDWNGRERMNSEFTLAALDVEKFSLPGSTLVSLATFGSPPLENGRLLVNGRELGLEPLSQQIVAGFRDKGSMSFDTLCAYLSNVPPEELRRTVLDLGRYDIVTIEH